MVRDTVTGGEGDRECRLQVDGHPVARLMEGEREKLLHLDDYPQGLLWTNEVAQL